MLVKMAQEYKHIPFLWILEKKYCCPFVREYNIIYDYEDNIYYQTGNTKLKPKDKDIKRIFRKLTTKAKTTTKYNPETKIYLSFPKPGIEQEIHQGIGIVTQVCVEEGEITGVIIETIYPDWQDMFNQPKKGEYEFIDLSLLEF